jgi:hypothetical protein
VRDPSLPILALVVFGALGTGYFVYGKKQANGWAMLAGVGLCVFPYFVSDFFVQLAVGTVLLALPFLFRN